MKAWELTRDLLRDTKPVVRTAEEQTWDASAVMKAQDDLMAMFWKSNVPGSAAPECLMAGALQSLENKGFVLAPYEELLRDGLAALGKVTLKRCIASTCACVSSCALHGPIRTIRRKRRCAMGRGTNSTLPFNGLTMCSMPSSPMISSTAPLPPGWRSSWALRLARRSKAIRRKTSPRSSDRSAIMCASQTPIMTTSLSRSHFSKPSATRGLL